MKQLLFLMMVTTACGLGSLWSPFWAVLLYYGLATLRPQNIWDWALPIQVRWSLLAAGLLFTSAIFHAPRLINHARVNAICAMMIAYGILVLMSVLSALNPSLAEAWAVEYGKIFVIAIIASLVIQHYWQVWALALTVMASLGYLAYEINHLYLTYGRLDVFNRGYGGLDNNGAGLLVAMGIPFALAFASCEFPRWSYLIRGISGLFALFMLHAVMMTYSRGAMLAASAGLVWYFLHHRPRWQAGMGAAVVIAAILVLAGPQIRDEFLSTRNYQEDASAQSRFKSWNAAWDIAWDFPLFGAGIRNANLLTHGYGADINGRTVHNQYLQVAADSGIPAGVCYCALVFGSIWYTRKARVIALRVSDDESLAPENREEADNVAKLCLGIQTSLVIFAVNAVFLSLEVLELPWVLMVMAGVAPAAVAGHLSRWTDADGEPIGEEDEQSTPASPALGVPA